MSCNEPLYADITPRRPNYRAGSLDQPLYYSVFGAGGACTVWDGAATTWDSEATSWDCGPVAPPLYAPNSIPMPSYRSVLEGGVCTIWDGAATLWDEYEVAGVVYFTRWDCAGNPPSDDLEDVCQA